MVSFISFKPRLIRSFETRRLTRLWDRSFDVRSFGRYSHNLATLAIALCDFLVVFIGSMILGGVCAIGTAFVLKIVRVADRRVGADARPVALRRFGHSFPKILAASGRRLVSGRE